MRVLALDYGTARCGCAISDLTGTVVRPLDVVEPPDPEAVAALAREQGVDLVVVGIPVGLGGEEGPQAARTREFAETLAPLLDVSLETWDERFTTRLAERSAREGARAQPDSLAAAHLLESYLHAHVDPFLAEDPEAREREARRLEREAQRREPEGHPRPSWFRALSVPRRIGAAAALLTLVLLVWFAVALFQPFAGEGEGKVVVKVPRGANLGEIADLLDERGVISSSTLFEIRVTLAGRRSDLLAGTYTLAEGMSYSAVLDRLTTPPGERTTTVLIPEGLSRQEIEKLVAKSGIEGSYAKATQASPSTKPLLERYGAGGADDLEGFLFPATYELKARADAEDLVAKQLDAFERSFRRVDLSYAESKNLTPYEVLIIASMIEREVMVPSERPLVSAVIYNRLADGEPLGIDATIRYATGNYERPLTQSELAIDSPYNTRNVAGLPPTPIGNPGLDAIEAATNPADVDYRYYVVKPGTCGEHEFASTLEEFDAAAARYNAAREAAGGKSPVDCPKG